MKIAILLSTVTSPPASSDPVWKTPDIVEQTNSYTVKAMVMAGPGQTFVLAVGRYRVWFLITDAPEESMIPSPTTFRIV